MRSPPSKPTARRLGRITMTTAGWTCITQMGGEDHRLFHNEGTGRFVSFTNLVTKPLRPSAGAWGDY